MALIPRKITLFSPDSHRAMELLLELFPERERLSMPWLRFRSLGRMVEFFGYHDEKGAFCGFSYVIYTDKMAYVLYLAVESTMHSKGYGSEIMHMILQRHAGKDIVLSCEPENEKAENAQQRVRRIRFYERLELKNTNYQYVVEEQEPYTIMSSRVPLSVDEFTRLIRKFSFGFFTPKVKKAAVCGDGA